MTVYVNDMLTPTFLMGAIKERPERNAIRQSYMGERLFPRREVPERRLMWDSIASENNLAGFYSPKGHAIPGHDSPFQTHFRNLVDVKASRYLDPDIVGKIRDLGELAVVKEANGSFLLKSIQQRVQNHVRENLAWCDDAVDAQLEYMAVHAMLGELVWPPKADDGTDITDVMPHWNAKEEVGVTFPLKATFKQNVTTLTGYNGRTGTGLAWTNNNADPILDLEILAELFVETTGLDAHGATIIMSRGDLSRLAFQSKLLQWIRGTNYEQGNAQQFADVDNVKNFITTRLGYNIVTYDAQWTYKTLNKVTGVEEIKRVRFLPRGKVLILPRDARPGFMAMSPHEAQDASWRAGKIPWVYRQPMPPYEQQMGVDVVAFPILERPEEHIVLDIYA